MVLTLDEDYFNIRGGLERWLYLFARKTSGWQSGGWTESIESIYQKSSSMGSLSEFKRKLRNIERKQSLLGYTMETIEGRRGDGIYFLRKNELIEMSSDSRGKARRNGATEWRKS
jgi:plasmid replication initiation protein